MEIHTEMLKDASMFGNLVGTIPEDASDGYGIPIRMILIPPWLLTQLEGMAIGYAAVASGGLEWWIRKLKHNRPT